MKLGAFVNVESVIDYQTKNQIKPPNLYGFGQPIGYMNTAVKVYST